MEVHLIDGTYELFRHYFAVPSHVNKQGEEVGAVRGALASIIGMLENGVTHIGVATDQVIESFRNAMWAGYKTGEGIEPELFSQFPIFEEAVAALGVIVWAMVEQEADDGLAAAAQIAEKDSRVSRVFICTPDKDLAQCVLNNHVIQFDRRNNVLVNEDGVKAKYGVWPTSIPDWLALVGDSADGFPGLPGWGAKSSSTVLARYTHLEDIPHDVMAWDIQVRGAMKLAAALKEHWEEALLFRDLATLRRDADVGTVDSWQWMGPTADFEACCDRLDAPKLVERVEKVGR